MALKKVIREGIPETNSSSSHSVIITELKNNIDDFSTFINSEGIMVVPSFDWAVNDFGNSSYKEIRDFYQKLTLVVSLFATNHSLTELLRFLEYLKRIICSFTGVRDVKFEVIDKLAETFDRIRLDASASDSEYDSLDDISYFTIEGTIGLVDHQSVSELSLCILEDKESIKNFLFNPDSWLFLGSDSCDMSELIRESLVENYPTITREKIIIKVHFGHNLGRIDFPTDEGLYLSNLEEVLEKSRHGLLRRIAFNVTEQKYIIRTNEYYNFSYQDSDDIEFSILLVPPTVRTSSLLSPILFTDDGIYLTLFSGKFQKAIYKYISDLGEEFYSEYCEKGEKMCGKILYDLCKKVNLTEGVDWMKIKLEVVTEKFGTL